MEAVELERDAMTLARRRRTRPVQLGGGIRRMSSGLRSAAPFSAL
jgi:hypothetical protein